MNQQIVAQQQKLMSNPQSMATLQEMMQDPEIMQALQDPAVVQAVTSHDYAAVQNNPQIQKLMSNPKMQALLQKLAAQQQQNYPFSVINITLDAQCLNCPQAALTSLPRGVRIVAWTPLSSRLFLKAIISSFDGVLWSNSETGL